MINSKLYENEFSEHTGTPIGLLQTAKQKVGDSIIRDDITFSEYYF